MKIFKKLDLIIIVSLVVLSFIPHILFAKTLYKNNSSTYASIKISGDFYKNIPLDSNKNVQHFVVETPNGNNTLVVKDNSIQIKDADCHDEICIKQGVISKVGQSIICLPHELVIEIKGDSDSNSNDFILSH